MDNLQIKSEINNAKNINKPVLFKGILKHTPDWNYVMKYLDKKFNETPIYDVKHNEFLKNKNKEVVPIFKYGDFDLQAWFINLPECNQMSKIFSLDEKHVNDMNFKILIDFLGTGENNTIHKDRSEVYSWTWINSIEYRIYEDNDYPFEQSLDIHNQPYESFIIEAGDVLYMPKGIIHQSIINEPRVSLIASI
jgi:hypothetical protein